MTTLTRREFGATAAAALAGGACSQSGRRVIGVIPKATSHLFFVSIHAGVKRAANEFRIDVLWNGPSDETDHNRQIQILDSMVAQRVSAIAISATDERALTGPVQRAIQTGIPVTLFDSGVETQDYVTFVSTDNKGAGELAAERLAALVSGKGKVAMVMQKPGGNSTGFRETAFEATIGARFPGIALAARQYCMADRARALAAAENILTAHPDVAGIFCSSEAASLGTIQALRSRGAAGKVRLVTFDTSELHVEALGDGTIDLMLVQDSVEIGYQAVASLARKLRGDRTAKLLPLPAREIVKASLGDPAVMKLLRPA